MNHHSLTRIYLIRHCKAEGQEAGAKLTSEGFQQAQSLTDFLALKQIDYIISSTYKRAIETIEPFAKSIDVKINTDARLCERILSSENLPNWEEELYHSFQDAEMRLPGGETSLEAMQRGISVLEELCQSSKKSIAVVTHGNLMCLMLRHYDSKYGFADWKNLTNPDVFELLIPTEGSVGIKRIWR